MNWTCTAPSFHDLGILTGTVWTASDTVASKAQKRTMTSLVAISSVPDCAPLVARAIIAAAGKFTVRLPSIELRSALASSAVWSPVTLAMVWV